MTSLCSPWFKAQATNSNGKIRLFCFPFAGAGASAYQGWQQHLHPDIQLISVQLPGRENRFSEPAISDMAELLALLTPLFTPFTLTPWAVFGHSMGAAISYQLVNRLTELGCSPPIRLFVSAKTPPHMPPSAELIGDLPDQQLIETLAQRYKADVSTPGRELLELMLPTLRADFRLIESPFAGRLNVIPSPITAFNGSLDHSVDAQQMSQWSRYSNDEFEQIEVNGPHFYLQSAARMLTTIINARLHL
ncbi:thioesterase II family protein [Aliiglaciecola litoralis]|uniref:Thioesterase domain-containing protein n=1 Tax=Aliiglaciecola litoralis TaxID=582857 RepID=A0ABN1LIH7_9ALTE